MPTPRVDPSAMLPVEQIDGEVARHPDALRALAEEARDLLAHHSQIAEVGATYLLAGDGEVALFLADCRHRDGTEDQAWILVGDAPPSMLGRAYGATGYDALVVYVDQVGRWVRSARAGRPAAGLIPVLSPGEWQRIEPTEENLDWVESKLKLVADQLLHRHESALRANRFTPDLQT